MSTLPPGEFLPRRVEAKYSVPENDLWQDNPLIEALPYLFEDEEFIKLTAFLPPHRRGMIEHDKKTRLTYIRRILQFFQPMSNHVLLNQRISSIIREGYIPRNPISDLGWTQLHSELEELKDRLKYGIAPHAPPSELGFSIIGIGGVGKTLGINSIMRMYPQVIVHGKYTDKLGRNHSLMRTQIVYVRLTCPSDGTLKSLCVKFFKEIDRLTGTTTCYRDYAFKGTVSRNATEMLPDMALVAAIYSIGLLVIDEIQFLSKQKSGGRELMLHWFTELVDSIKIPVVLIGTPKADEILNSAFWQMRRNAGQGEMIWNRMPNGTEWQRFVKLLWRYQYVKNPTQLISIEGKAEKIVPRNLSDKLYDESQGIADFAVKIFMISQERAINSGLEEITEELIEIVAKDAFGKAREILQAIKNNTKDALARVDDVQFDLTRARESASKKPFFKASTTRQTRRKNQGTNAAIPVLDEISPKSVLPALLDEAKEKDFDVIDVLKKANYVASPVEFGY